MAGSLTTYSAHCNTTHDVSSQRTTKIPYKNSYWPDTTDKTAKTIIAAMDGYREESCFVDSDVWSLWWLLLEVIPKTNWKTPLRISVGIMMGFIMFPSAAVAASMATVSSSPASDDDSIRRCAFVSSFSMISSAIKEDDDVAFSLSLLSIIISLILRVLCYGMVAFVCLSCVWMLWYGNIMVNRVKEKSVTPMWGRGISSWEWQLCRYAVFVFSRLMWTVITPQIH